MTQRTKFQWRLYQLVLDNYITFVQSFSTRSSLLACLFLSFFLLLLLFYLLVSFLFVFYLDFWGLYFANGVLSKLKFNLDLQNKVKLP